MAGRGGRAGRGRRDGGGGSLDDRRHGADRRARSDRRGEDRRRRDRRRAERRHRADRRRLREARGARGPASAAPDARTGRGDETREALVDAVLEAVTRDRTVPGLTAVARVVDVTPRLVHYHFSTHRLLIVAATAAQQERTRTWLRPADPGGPPEARVAHTLRSRRALQRALGLLHLAVAAHPAGRGLDEPVLVEHRVRLREQLAATFAQELEAAAGDDATLLDALDTAAGWAGWWPTVPAADRARVLLLLIRPDLSRSGGGPAR